MSSRQQLLRYKKPPDGSSQLLISAPRNTTRGGGELRCWLSRAKRVRGCRSSCCWHWIPRKQWHTIDGGGDGRCFCYVWLYLLRDLRNWVGFCSSAERYWYRNILRYLATSVYMDPLSSFFQIQTIAGRLCYTILRKNTIIKPKALRYSENIYAIFLFYFLYIIRIQNV